MRTALEIACRLSRALTSDADSGATIDRRSESDLRRWRRPPCWVPGQVFAALRRAQNAVAQSWVLCRTFEKAAPSAWPRSKKKAGEEQLRRASPAIAGRTRRRPFSRWRSSDVPVHARQSLLRAESRRHTPLVAWSVRQAAFNSREYTILVVC